MHNNPEVCKELLEILLEMKLDRIEMRQEEEVEIDYGKKGLGKYSFENICREDSKIKLNDRTYKYIFIAQNYDKILNREQQAFLKLVLGNESSGSFAAKISQMVEEAKQVMELKEKI